MAGGAAQAASPPPPLSASRSAPGSPAAAAASARGSGSSRGAACPCGAERRAGVGTALRPALQSPVLPARMLGRPPPPSAPAPPQPPPRPVAASSLCPGSRSAAEEAGPVPARPRAECGVGTGGRASRRQAWKPQTARLEAQRLDALPLPLSASSTSPGPNAGTRGVCGGPAPLGGRRGPPGNAEGPARRGRSREV